MPCLRGLIVFKESVKNKNIVLTGFMGTGKTAVGEILAAALNRSLIDTDRLIEEKTALTVLQIFKQHGEAYFRDQESAVIAGLGKYPSGSLVIATGGGAVLQEKNMKLLSENGLIILLTASPRAILRRLSKTSQRPLLAGPGTAEKIKAKLLEREQYYRHYSFRVDTTGLAKKQVARKIINYLKSV